MGRRGFCSFRQIPGSILRPVRRNGALYNIFTVSADKKHIMGRQIQLQLKLF